MSTTETETLPEGFAAFFRGYVTCALWSSTDDEENQLDARFGEDDIAPETLAEMRADCLDFMQATTADLAEMMERTGLPFDHMGHDFWLTRNGHGVGFWDRGAGPVGDRLSDAATAHGEVYLHVGDDGKVYGYPPRYQASPAQPQIGR